MKSLLQKLNLTLYIALLVMMSGCENYDLDGSESEPQLLDMNNIDFVISRSLPMGNLSDSEASEEEWIYDWHLVIVDNKGKIEVVLDRSGFNGLSTTPVESETVNTSNSIYADYFDKDKEDFNVYEGEKHIYAFANMPVPEEMKTIGNYISHTAAMALTSSVNGNSLGTPSKDNPIPMSNVITVTLNNELNQHVDIPLFRMLAKVEFTFKTLTEVPIDVQKIVMNNITMDGTNNIYTFANLDSNGYPLVPETSVEGHHEHLISPYIAVSNKDTEGKIYTIYVNESTPPYSETIGFTLTTKREDRETTELRYALTIARGLRRNDFLKIPVTLTDYEFNPRIDFAPPIGGYGEAEVSSDAGEVFFVKVNSGGQIILRPQLYNASTKTPIADDDANLTIETSVVVGDNVLATPLTFNNLDDWWEATIDGSKKGRILFTLTYEVQIGSASVRERV